MTSCDRLRITQDQLKSRMSPTLVPDLCTAELLLKLKDYLIIKRGNASSIEAETPLS